MPLPSGASGLFSLQAGVSITEVVSPFSIPLDPVLAALFGQSSISGTIYDKTVYPSGGATLKRHFRNAGLTFNYYRGVNAGNGAFSAGRLDNATVSLSYTGIRKLNVGLDGGYFAFSSIGESTGKYSTYSGGRRL